MSLFDILNKKNITEALGGLLETAKTQSANISQATPGGMGGLLGAGALGTLLGSMMSGGREGSNGALQNAALLGAGAVAWNFYQKWSQKKEAEAAAAPSAVQPVQTAPAAMPAAAPAPLDPTAKLLLRVMVFAARADGHIDETEQERIRKVVAQMAPGQNCDVLVHELINAPIDPSLVASEVRSPEQGEDIYRLSCMIIDIDHFMERSYIDALAGALHIDEARKQALEAEAAQAKAQL